MRRIIDYVSDDNPDAAESLEHEIHQRVSRLRYGPFAYRAGRAPDTREMVVHPNYIVIYRVTTTSIIILRVLHAAQRWP
jgi:toxin ParE1/3/4